MPENVKTCTMCQVAKSLDQFGSDISRKDGLHPHCKECKKEWRKANSHLLTARSREWNRANPKRTAEYKKTWRNRDPGKTRSSDREKTQRWRHLNPEKERANRKRYYENLRSDPVRLDERRKKQSNYSSQWAKSNPEKVRITKNTRRARIAGAGGTYTSQEWNALCEYFHNKCLCCGSNDPLTADHVVPLSSGGSNTIDNLQPLCFSCNCKKGTKTIDYRPLNFP